MVVSTASNCAINRRCARHLRRQLPPDAVPIDGLEGAFERVPGGGAREKGLADMEAQAVVVRVQKPGRHIATRAVFGGHSGRIKNVQPQQLDLIARWASGLLGS